MGQQFKPFLMQMQGTIQNPPPGMFQWCLISWFLKIMLSIFSFWTKQTQLNWVDLIKVYLKVT